MPGTARFEIGAVAIDPRVINGFYPPVRANLVGYYELFPSRVSGTSLVNLVNPALPATIVGEVTFDATTGALTTGGSAYVDTGLSQSTEYTWLVDGEALTVSATSAGRTALISNYESTGNLGATLQIREGTAASPGGRYTHQSGGTIDVQSTNVLGRRIHMARRRTADMTLREYLTSGVDSTISASAPVLGTRTLRIGSAWHTTQFTGQARIRRVAIYAGALSDGDAQTMAQFWQS